MNALVFLVPAALALGLLGLGFFLFYLFPVELLPSPASPSSSIIFNQSSSSPQPQ